MPKQVDRFRMRPSMGPIDDALITERSDEEIAAGGKWNRKWHGIQGDIKMKLVKAAKERGSFVLGFTPSWLLMDG